VDVDIPLYFVGLFTLATNTIKAKFTSVMDVFPVVEHKDFTQILLSQDYTKNIPLPCPDGKVMLRGRINILQEIEPNVNIGYRE
jgi:hypothetical protein